MEPMAPTDGDCLMMNGGDGEFHGVIDTVGSSGCARHPLGYYIMVSL